MQKVSQCRTMSDEDFFLKTNIVCDDVKNEELYLLFMKLILSCVSV